MSRKARFPKVRCKKCLTRGFLHSETLVWSESLTKRTPASKVELFRIKTIPSPPPLPPKQPSPPTLLKKVTTSRLKKSSGRLNNYIKMICRLSNANGLFTNDVQRPFKSALQTGISKTKQRPL